MVFQVNTKLMKEAEGQQPQGTTEIVSYVGKNDILGENVRMHKDNGTRDNLAFWKQVVAMTPLYRTR